MTKTCFYIDLNAELIQQIKSSLNPTFECAEIKVHRVGKSYSSTFNIWKKDNPSLKIETTITKRSISELVDAIIKYIS